MQGGRVYPRNHHADLRRAAAAMGGRSARQAGATGADTPAGSPAGHAAGRSAGCCGRGGRPARHGTGDRHGDA